MDGLRCEPLPDGLRRYAAYDGVGLHVPSHHRPGGHDGAVTDPHAGEDDGLIADPDIAADDNVPRLSQASVISETDVSHAS